MADTQYVPGVCNINSHEIAVRQRTGNLGLAIGVLGLVVAVVFGEPAWTGLLLAFPFWLAAVGYLQAKNRFCIANGAAGIQMADETMTAPVSVPNALDAAKDKRRAMRINTQAMGLGLAAGIAAAVLLWFLFS